MTCISAGLPGVRRGLAGAALVACGSISGVAAQAPAGEARILSLAVGAFYAGESIPQPMNSRCGHTAGREAGDNLGIVVSGRVGRFSIEGRVGNHYTTDYVCPGSLRDVADGVHTFRVPDMSAGDFGTTDLRLRIGLGRGGWLDLAAGGGWIWSKEVAYVTSSVGLRHGASLRYGVDLEVTTYRLPWLSRTATYLGGSMIEILNERPYREWATGLGLRLVLEVPIVSLRL